MRGVPLKKVARAALPAAAFGCVAIGFVLNAPFMFLAAGAVSVAGLALAAIMRRRGSPGSQLRERHEPDGREEATRVAVPWRSSPFWDEFDLVIGAARESAWFCFYGHAGDSITLAAELSQPGRGIRVSLFDADEQHPSLAEASSDGAGSVSLTAPTATTGIHYVQVQAEGGPHPDPQHYRMSIAGPTRVREAGSARGRHNGFADLPLWHPHHDAVQAVAEAGLMKGRLLGSDLKFGPDRPIWEVDLIQIVDSALAGLGEDVSALLEGWHIEMEGGRGGTAGRATRDATRSRVLSRTVGAFDHAFPDLLARPPAVRSEPASSESGTREAWHRIADHNGLLTGLDGFTDDAGLETLASRGEVAQLLYSALQLVNGSSPQRLTRAATHAAADTNLEPLSDSDSDTLLAHDFIHGANAALDSLIGADVPVEVSVVTVNVDTEELRSAVEAMRERHHARAQTRIGSSPPSSVPSNGSAQSSADSSHVGGPNGARGATSDPGGSLAEPLRKLRPRRKGRAPARFKPRP
ncbi:MAG: S-layer homology domain-containing protein [Thermoleophilia bacterium]